MNRSCICLRSNSERTYSTAMSQTPSWSRNICWHMIVAKRGCHSSILSRQTGPLHQDSSSATPWCNISPEHFSSQSSVLGLLVSQLPPVQETHCREASAKAAISTDTVTIMKNTFMSGADFFSVKKSRSSVVRFKVTFFWGCLFTPLFTVGGVNLGTRLIPVCHANSCCITCTNCGSLVDVFQNDFLIQTSKDD